VSAPEKANARRQPGERVILTNYAPSIGPVSPGIKLISFADGERRMTGEEYLARKYCEPKAYWHCLHELEPSGPTRYYTFNELNSPEYWLKAAAKYIQGKPTAACAQLHRRVETARAEFKAKQEKAWGNKKVGHHPDFERKEELAWNTFNAQKQAYLKEYLWAIRSGRSGESEAVNAKSATRLR
jgi:hypothetical protein